VCTRALCQRDDVGAGEQCVEVVAVGVDRCANDFVEMWTLRLEDVVVPVRSEKGTMPIEVRVIRVNAVGAVQDGEEIWKEVDDHQQPGREDPAQTFAEQDAE
jgi:hypothetical protein